MCFHILAQMSKDTIMPVKELSNYMKGDSDGTNSRGDLFRWCDIETTWCLASDAIGGCILPPCYDLCAGSAQSDRLISRTNST